MSDRIALPDEVGAPGRTEGRQLVVLLVGLVMILLLPASILSSTLGLAGALVVGGLEIGLAWRVETEPGAGVLRVLLAGFGVVTVLIGIAAWLL